MHRAYNDTVILGFFCNHFIDSLQGDLRITFDVVFPATLSEHQRTMMKAAFFLPPKLDTKQAKALRSFENAFRDESHGWITAFRKDGQPALQ